jgi:hypothetical protein
MELGAVSCALLRMSADIIDIRTRKPWPRERVERAKRLTDTSRRADCTAPFYDLIFQEIEAELHQRDLLLSPHPR